MSTQDAAEREGILQLCRQAGVLPSEMHDDPVHGLCVSISGVRKLAVIAPDQTKAYALLRQMETMAKPGKAGLQ